MDGYDEITLTGPAKVLGNKVESILNPEDFGLTKITAQELEGGDSIEKAAQIFIDVLQGKGTQSQEAVVCVNAGMAIATATGCTPREGYEKACESLKSRSAQHSFKKLQALSA